MQIAQSQWTKYAEGFWERSTDSVNRMLSWDYDHYLVDNLLVKMDIAASMAHGLEVRSPFLDQELVQKFAGMPPELKLNKKKDAAPVSLPQGKVPDQLLNSKKKVFLYQLVNGLERVLNAYLRITLKLCILCLINSLKRNS